MATVRACVYVLSGHIHAMIAAERLLNARNVTLHDMRSHETRDAAATDAHDLGVDASGGLSLSAQSSDDGTRLVVRVVNPYATPIGPSGSHNVSLRVALGPATRCATCTLKVLAAAPAAANPSWAPGLVSPQEAPCQLGDGGRSATVAPLAPFSYSVLTLGACKA